MLPNLNNINVLFQSKGQTIHLLHDKITDLYRQMLDCFCFSNKIAKFPLSDIDPCDQSNYKPVEQIYLGAELHALF